MTPISVEAVSKVYPPGVRALDDVTFRIARGERVCLLGPNGAGKTTLIRLFVGALRPTTGRITLFGADVDAPSFLEVKRRLGVVPQGPGMYRNMTVLAYLKLVQRLYRRGALHELIGAFGLGPYLDRRMADLSGGWQRRLVLAAALLPQPELLLLDEPTAGLDPVATRDVHAFLRTALEGRTAVLCTHNLAEAEALCSSVVILRDGRMVVHDSIAELRRKSRPSLLLRALQGTATLAEALQAMGKTPVVDGEQVRLVLEEGERDVPPLLRALLAAGLDIIEARQEEPSLEDLFLKLVRPSDAQR